MELRRNTRVGPAVDVMAIAAIRLAIMLSVVAVMAATILHTLGLSQPIIVLGTIVVGFTTSWVRTGQVVERRVVSHHPRHHVTLPARSVQLPVS